MNDIYFGSVFSKSKTLSFIRVVLWILPSVSASLKNSKVRKYANKLEFDGDGGKQGTRN